MDNMHTDVRVYESSKRKNVVGDVTMNVFSSSLSNVIINIALN